MISKRLISAWREIVYSWVIILHNLLRWLVLGAGTWIFIRTMIGLRRSAAWSPLEQRASLIYTVVMDLQVLFGLALYAFLSPLTKLGFQDFQRAMSSRDIRYFLVEHAFFMLVAWVLVHLGSVLVKRGSSDRVKYRRAVIWFGLSFLVLLLGTPWMRPLLPSLFL